ncbi:TPA: hypothetical protein DCX15_04605 [bacterium]|nr:hypothetical protein [bacterium]
MKSFCYRLISGLLFAPFLIYAILSPTSIPFLVFITAVIILAFSEFYSLVEKRGFKAYRYLGMLLGGFVIVISGMGFNSGLAFDGFIISLGVILYLLGRSYGKGRMAGSLAISLAGVIYLGWTFSHLIWLRNLENGQHYLFMCFAITWGIDISAYLVGSLIGRHKLIPKISPKKSFEGAIGGLIAAILVSIIGGSYMIPAFSPRQLLTLGLLLGVSAQLGDIVESIIKRDFGVKDSGNLIPGHGGVLDVFDGFTLSAPVMFHFIRYTLPLLK